MSTEPSYPVHLPIAEALRLKFHLRDTQPGVDPDAFVVELVQHWLDMHDERTVLKAEGPAIHGFQWKNLFLPEGTQLRTSYHQKAEFAKVIGDFIVSDDGVSLTPSQFANRRTTGRNAWRFIWLRFPGNASWGRAIHHRVSGSEGV